MHHHSTIDKLKRSRNIKAVGKYSKLVCPAIPIGIFQNHNTILAAAIRPEIPWIRIFNRFNHPEAPLLVPVHVNRIYNIRFGGKQLYTVARLHNHPIDGCDGIQRLLLLVVAGIIGSPVHRPYLLLITQTLLVRGRKRYIKYHIGERVFNGAPSQFFLYVLARSPTNSPLQKLMETRVLPGSLIMAPGGIKYTPISLGTYPGPRLIITVAQDEHTSELQSRGHLVCRLLLEKKNISTVR